MPVNPVQERSPLTNSDVSCIVSRCDFSQTQSSIAQTTKHSKEWLVDPGQEPMVQSKEHEPRIHTVQKISSKFNGIIRKRDKEHEREQKKLKVAEKARKRYLGGMAWGYDPKAGLKEPAHKHANDLVLKSLSDLGVYGNGELQLEQSDHRWGVEHGGPSKDGRYGN